MKVLRSFPLLFIVLVSYTFFAFLDFQSAGTVMGYEIFRIPLTKNTPLALTLEEAFLLFGLILLFIEIVKSTSASDISIMEHAFSTFVLIAFLGELLIFPEQLCRASFVLLSVMSLIDVIAGITISITAARRDWMSHS